jgi:hypothetical protein
MEKHDLAFWLSVAGATMIKLLTSQYGGPLKVLLTVLAAVFSAYFFTIPAMHILGLDPEVYTTVMAAVMAVTGEGLMRWVMKFVDTLPYDPGKLIDLIRRWRSGK